MVPAVTMQIEKIPLNQNQKVNKRALPKPVKSAAVTQQQTEQAPLNLLEQELHEMVAGIIGNTDFGITTVLGYVGLTSISAIKLAIQVNKRYGITLNAKSLVKSGTLQSIENEIWKSLMRNEKLEMRNENEEMKNAADSHSSFLIPHSSFPLSYAQTGVYLDCLKNPSSTLYNIPCCIKFKKDIDTTALAEAIKTLVKAHPQMTVHFGNGEEGVIQTVNLEQAVVIPVKQMSEKELEAYKREFVQPFNLSTEPLYRFEIVTTEKQTYLLMDIHHLVFDGGSVDIFLQQLCSVLDGRAIEEEEQSYANYVKDEKAAEGGEDYQSAKEWFKTQLQNVEAATEVQSDLKDPVQGTIGVAHAAIDIEAINTFCRTRHITPAHLILGAVYYSLSRFSNSEQVCITTVSSGRSNLRIRNTVGMFVNTLVLSATIGKQTVSEFLQEVSNTFDETLSHENYPFAQIAADYGLTAKIQFVYQLGVFNQYICQGTPLEMDNMELQAPKFPITFFISELQGQPSVSVEYDNGKYSARLMQSLADAVKVTVERMMAKPDAALTSISIVSDEEAQRIIKIGTGKEIDVDLSKTFANLFTEQARRTPDAPAVVDRDSQLTYGEMDRYSNALARQLIDFGVQPNDFVCVMLDRFKEFPLAVLAIHKAGAAYTPLDFEYPNERLSYMLENSESKVLITSHDVLEAKQAEGDFSTAAARTFFIDDFMSLTPNPSLKGEGSDDMAPIDLSNPDGLAYMIYTSGSTGKPKGAMLHQAGLRNFIAVVIDMEKLTGDDRISGHRSFSFDAHIEDMYPVLTLGGSFHIMPTEIRKDLAAIRQFLIDHKCTGGGYSTAMTSLLLNTFDDLPIRFTTGGGEKMDGVFSDHIEIINVYGPTECTDDTSYYSIAPGRRVENIPIGQSVANNWNFIVDTAGNLVPQGVAGELCFAGVQVGRGYWRLPERTAKSFVDCPFVKQDRWGRPVRMYHTGDLCRWNEDGQIEYMGRIDTQVKLRGFRIELGEIESKALNIEGIRQAAAEVRKVMGNEHLVLYYTLEANATLSDEDIRKTLAASSLADYMVPDAYMQMDSMPMTPNGKINRKALPAPEMKRATEYEAPKGEKEELFCSIFAEILKIKEVGATDNFFEIGGTSINAIKVIVEASKRGVQIVFNDLFTQKTPRALAAFVAGSETEATVPAGSPAGSTPGDIPADTPEAAHYAPLNSLLTSNTLASFQEGKRQTIGDVLLTGATGYLGIHILNELLTNYHGKILCPVRAKGNDEALSRIKTLYFYYFGRTEAFSHFDERVTAFVAEVTQPDGLDSITQQGLTVVNCVANVKHFSAGNDIEMVNIESVRHLISFCLRTDSRLIHISTNSIAGLSVDGMPGPDVKLTEQSLWLGQNIDENKYVYSKFKAEELVLDAIAHHGLNAKIMRVGNLSARQKDGEFQINFNTNNFLAMLRAYVVIGMVPYEALDQRFEFSPIDEVAHAIMQLGQTPKACTVFHPNNTHRQFLSDILNGFAEAGITLQRVEKEEFQKALDQMMENPDLVTLLRPLMAYNLSNTHEMRWIESTNEYTTQVLYRLGFQWPPTAADYVHRFVDTIIGFDYFSI
jgi:amino acid adenylation domain-containing protein/thioester reductase-like protein